MKVETSELQRIVEVMEERNLSINDVITLIQEKSESVQAIAMGSQFNLSVDYSRTLAEMINAGNYDWADSAITAKDFPLPAELSGQKTAVSKLFHFNRDISSDKAIAEMGKAGYRPATLSELLALGAKYPELQRQFPIIALSSVWHGAFGGRRVPYLGVGDYERGLGLDWFGRDWAARCRFLGVRK